MTTFTTFLTNGSLKMKGSIRRSEFGTFTCVLRVTVNFETEMSIHFYSPESLTAFCHAHNISIDNELADA
jgi:hypothetical protein